MALETPKSIKSACQNSVKRSRKMSKPESFRAKTDPRIGIFKRIITDKKKKKLTKIHEKSKKAQTESPPYYQRINILINLKDPRKRCNFPGCNCKKKGSVSEILRAGDDIVHQHLCAVISGDRDGRTEPEFFPVHVQ